MNYLDTSALIKRFVIEKGSPQVESLVGQGGPVATSKIAYAEVYAGLARKHREGYLPGSQYALACRQFESDWQAYVRLDLQDEILILAHDLIQHHPLRGFDAIHLASALSLKTALGEDITFAVADAGMSACSERSRQSAFDLSMPKRPKPATDFFDYSIFGTYCRPGIVGFGWKRGLPPSP